MNKLNLVYSSRKFSKVKQIVCKVIKIIHYIIDINIYDKLFVFSSDLG